MWSKFRRVAARFGRSRQGNVAMVFGLTGAVTGMLVFGALDVGRAVNAKSELQAALDAATLVTARGTDLNDPNTKLQSVGTGALNANLVNEHAWELTEAHFSSASDGVAVVSTAKATVDTVLLGTFANDLIEVSASSEVLRPSKNVELSLVLDVTGSMVGQRLTDLKTAAKDLVDIIVKTNQTPYYSKVAVVPYSMGVNVGTLADTARGTIAAGKTITNATRANPVVITSPNHGFTNGQKVYITGVGGMTQINNRLFTVASASTNSFALSGVNGSTYGTFNGNGKAWCTTAGCEYYAFSNAWIGSTNVHQVSTCVTERTGTEAYTDAAPSVVRLGRNYPAAANPCLTNTITTLTSDKTTLKTNIDALIGGGSTAGHVGVAWGWYLLSPNFASILPSASKPADYTKPNTLKVMVLMTDGEYNSPYCNGVIAADATSGSGSVADHINCNAPNGSAYSQALSLCTKMKAAGVTVYTVGLEVVDDQRARDLVNGCATDSDHVYLPSSGTALRTAFRAIAVGIDELRIAH